MMRLSNRHCWLVGGVLAATLLSGCENPGLSGRDEELWRLRSAGEFSMVEASAKRVVLAARNERIVVEPPKGYCLDKKSFAVTQNAAFVLIADCLGSQDVALVQEAGNVNAFEMALPRVFPGILTVSISGQPAYGPQADALDAFEELLGSAAGSKLLSRGNNSAPGQIIATRRIGGALYVLIEESPTYGSLVLARRFWRAFIDLNERLTLVTVSSFSDRPIAEDAMMGFLAQQMVVLRQVNGLPADKEENQIAIKMAASFDVADGQGGVTVIRAKRVVAVSARPDPLGAPVPPQRLASAGNLTSVSAPSSAPHSSPAAPRRP